MSLIEHILSLLLMVGMSHALAKVDVHYGQLSAKGYTKCEITHNDEVLKYTGPEKKLFPGLRFGLISYNCDNHVGHLISPFECKKCGFFCSYNEYILGCQQEDVPFWLGVIVGILLAAMIGGFLSYCFNKFLNSRDSFSRRTVHTSVNANEEAFLNNGGKEASDESGLEPFVSEKVPGGFSKMRGDIPSAPSNKTSLKVLLTGLLLSKTTNACDLTFFMSSNQLQRVCNKTSCHDASNYTYPLPFGREVCFEDHLGETVSLSVSKIYVKSRHVLTYFTSDYKVTNLTTLHDKVKCQRDEENCYSSAYNYYNCHYDTLTRLNEELDENEIQGAQGWSCKALDVWYDYSTKWACGRYFWQVEKLGDLYPVYFKANQGWEAKLLVRQYNSFQEITLSTYDPATVLTGLTPYTVHSIPMSLLNFSSIALPLLPKTLLKYKEKLMFVNASAVNRPKSNIIGDYQVMLDKTRDVCASPAGVTCKAKYDYENDDCLFTCETREPISAINVLEKNLDGSFTQSDNFRIRSGDSVIDTYHAVNEGTFYMKLGEWNSEDLPVKTPAKCDIDFLMTYGCTDCNESSYIVMNSHNIDVEGLVPFNSNCSFDKRYVTCDLEPVKLVLKGVYDTCFIEMPTLNKTMLIDVQYLYLGHQINASGIIGLEETVSEVLVHLTASKHFIRTVVGTLFSCLIFELVLAFYCHNIATKRRNRRNVGRELPLVQFQS